MRFLRPSNMHRPLPRSVTIEGLALFPMNFLCRGSNLNLAISLSPLDVAHAGARFLLNEQITRVEKIEKKDSNGGENCTDFMFRLPLFFAFMVAVVVIGCSLVVFCLCYRFIVYRAIHTRENAPRAGNPRMCEVLRAQGH